MPLPIVIAVGIFALAVAALWPKKASASKGQEDKSKCVPSDTQQIVKAEVEATKQADVAPPVIPGAPLPAIKYPGSPPEPGGSLIQVPEKIVKKKVAAKIANPASLTDDEKQLFLDNSRPLVEAGRATKETINLYNQYRKDLGV